jgi:hypothetical protein
MPVPLVGKEKKSVSAVRMDVYEASGSVGRTGKPAGDVGFIHRAKNNKDEKRVKKNDKKKEGEERYFGFDNDEILKFK